MRIPAEVFHPSVFIQDEMDARGWTRDELARRMGGDFAVTRLSLDLYFSVHSRNLRMGEESISSFAKAFGGSEDYFVNLEKAWIEHPSSAVAQTAPELRIVRKADLPPTAGRKSRT